MFSTKWKSSKKPRKQHNYAASSPLHVRGGMFRAHLSDEMAKKFGKRSLRVRKEDKVKIIKGQFKGKSGKVEAVDTKHSKVYINGIEFQKKDGTKKRYPVALPNIIVTEVFLDDKKRQEALKRK